jgi:Sulfate permease family
MLVPQSLAYALLAEVPAQVGLYASMVPLPPREQQLGKGVEAIQQQSK